MDNLVFLKLGGSLITDKNTPQTVRGEVLARLAGEIAAALQADPALRLVLGHGSGSFGHMAARKFNTRRGVHSRQDWLGFCEVWRAARRLNQYVLEALGEAGVPALAFPPSAGVLAENGSVLRWDLSALQAALAAGLTPVVNGDTVFDTRLGGTILSTEDAFCALAGQLQPKRILLAGIEPGVWADYPACTLLLERLQAGADLQPGIGGSASPDVTGGMREKVELMSGLVQALPGLQALIFSGVEAGTVQGVLGGEVSGTVIVEDPVKGG